ncbi:MAG: rRNA pseudouridine synthase [Candidatus Aminicenantes bacterium]|nr:rRNA pseudouridine synthase [Candidatus Aminicenantes bacterium]MDH5742010.1 rRNA pseudouridine synthase [Candidatus Aminicenantes bacterium]
MKIRLNKFLAQAGVASRREADRMIAEGRVSVNGEIVESLGTLIDEKTDKVRVDGKRIKSDTSHIYLLLNKPSGYLVTAKDPFQRPTVMDLLPSLKKRIYPVGRLDFDSEGLLLLTNDGDLAHRLMHPRFRVKKEYLIRVKIKPDSSSLVRLEKGIYLDGKKTAPAKIRILSTTKRGTLIKVELHEGRKRELRRMFEAVGHNVLSLKRVSFGSLSLGGLKKGAWRHLKREELARLKKDVRLI